MRPSPGHHCYGPCRPRQDVAARRLAEVVAAQEAGGITPSTSVPTNVKLASGDTVTFIDTPDAAFSKMRGRGANVTDKQMGGDVLSVEISAKTGNNLAKLLEAILLQAELLDLKADPHTPAEGIVLEAKLERGRGVVATLLVQRGTLHEGETVVAGCKWGRVRALLNERSARSEQAGPSTPVEVLGLGGTPDAGDGFTIFEDEASARETAMARQAARRSAQFASHTRPTYSDMLAKIKGDGAKELPLVIKADAYGSIEAITATAAHLANDEVGVRFLHAAGDGVNESGVSQRQRQRRDDRGVQSAGDGTGARAREAGGRLYPDPC